MLNPEEVEKTVGLATWKSRMDPGSLMPRSKGEFPRLPVIGSVCNQPGTHCIPATKLPLQKRSLRNYER